MSLLKVCVFMPLPEGDSPLPEVRRSLAGQAYDRVETVIGRQRPRRYSDSPLVNLYRNCSATRNKARAIALKTDAECFFSLDSDIVLPPTAVAELVRQMRPDNRVVGGWYKMLKGPKWVAGKWVADNVFVNYRQPLPSLVASDVVGLGCAMMTREVLESIEFEHGTDLVARDEGGAAIYVGECGAFGNRCCDRGYRTFMDGDVVCEHLDRSRGGLSAPRQSIIRT